MIENKAGVSTKKVNDYVKQGDVIITGNIIKDETIKKQVPAEGIVFAEVWYNAYVEYPLYYEEIMYLDNVNNNLTISFFDKKISILKNYDNSYIMKSKTLYKNNILPFKISLDKMRKIKIVKNKLSKDEALNKAMMLAESKLSKKLNKQEYIISKNTLNFTSSSSKIKVDVFFKVYENITEYRNIEIVDPLETQN